MAVVQISKIQVRRGQKNSGIGIPQLSSAEFAWAIDTQELYIGNGSVAEGAPYVGNTKILTEKDNILSLASSYTFAYDDLSISESLPRSLQSKIDEVQVSVKDFGANGDGSTSCNTAFTNAFTELFRNTNDNYKKVLIVPNGEYLFTEDLKIPSGTIIRGETSGNAILNIGSYNILFITSTGLEVAEFDSSNRPTNIDISNITVLRTTGQVVLTGIADSRFEKVKFHGSYVFGDTVASITTEPSSVFWENSLIGTRVTDIDFVDCYFEGSSLAVHCDQLVVDSSSPPTFDTNIRFTDCKFRSLNTGIYISTDSLLINQSNGWLVDGCSFREVTDRAFYTTGPGKNTVIRDSNFKLCGNGTNSANLPAIEIIEFGDSLGNTVEDCTFDRHQAAAIASVDTLAAIAEVKNGNKVTIANRHTAPIYLSDAYRPLSVFSAFNKFLDIEYTLSLGGYTRKGIINVTIDDDLAQASILDNYTYPSASATAPGGALMTNFEFTVDLKNNNSDSGVDTLVLYYRNPLGDGATGTISYSVSYGV